MSLAVPGYACPHTATLTHFAVPPKRIIYSAQVRDQSHLCGAADTQTSALTLSLAAGLVDCGETELNMVPEWPLIFLTPPPRLFKGPVKPERRPSQPTADGSPSEAWPSLPRVEPGTRSLIQCQISALIWLNLLLTWNTRGRSREKKSIWLLAQTPPPGARSAAVPGR